jgi:hypothetical protein
MKNHCVTISNVTLPSRPPIHNPTKRVSPRHTTATMATTTPPAPPTAHQAAALSPLEQQLLDEYATLLENLRRVCPRAKREAQDKGWLTEV